MPSKTRATRALCLLTGGLLALAACDDAQGGDGRIGPDFHETFLDSPGAQAGGSDGSSGSGGCTSDLTTKKTVTVKATGEVQVGQVAQGQLLQFSANGTWCWGQCSDANGPPGRPAPSELPVRVSGANLGALGGRVGNNTFLIGTGKSIKMPSCGNLVLFMNERVGNYSGDNSGSLTVQITPLATPPLSWGTGGSGGSNSGPAGGSAGAGGACSHLAACCPSFPEEVQSECQTIASSGNEDTCSQIYDSVQSAGLCGD